MVHRTSVHLPSPLTGRPFTASDARAYGLTARDLRRLISARFVRHVLHDVYADARVPDSLDLRIAAVSLGLPPFAVVCDRAAAWLHGIDCLDVHELTLPPRVDVVVLRSYTRRRRGAVTPRVRDLAPDDVMSLDAVQVTTPLRTALDLGCQLRPRAALAALDQFARCHGVTPEDLEQELPRFRRRRGVVQLRTLLPLVSPKSESPGESWVRFTIVQAGLPVPELQHVVEVGGVPRYRLDLAYPALLVCIEYDGVEFHGSDAQRAADARRRAWLRANGWVVIVVTHSDWTEPRRQRWLAELSTAIAERRRPGGVRRFAKPTAPAGEFLGRYGDTGQ
jgi:hypothetical protein